MEHSATAEPHVTDADAFALRMERDPLLRSTIVSVAVLDRSPDWSHFVRRMDRATRLTPSFRQRLVDSPLGLAPPRLVFDPHFDLSWHLRRVRVAEGGGLDEVLEHASRIGVSSFDPEKPLWEITLFEGLSEGRAALVIKVHHALTDGIGGMQIAAHAVDLTREPVEFELPPAPVGGHHDPVVDLAEALGHDLRAATRAGATVVKESPNVLARALADPIGLTRRSLTTVSSLGRFVRPIVSTRSPIMRERHPGRAFSVIDVPLEPMRQAAHTVGGSLNDAFVAGIAGGLRAYHDSHGVMVDRLRMTMPVSQRTDHDAEGGNRVTLVRFDLPVERLDPQRRIAEVGKVCRAERDEPALVWSNQVAAVLNRLPVSTVGGMLKHVDVVGSNVPGLPEAVYVSGARVESFHPFGPTVGAAVNVTLMSYRDMCHIGINVDTGAVTNTDLFVACMKESFAEVTGVADH